MFFNRFTFIPLVKLWKVFNISKICLFCRLWNIKLILMYLDKNNQAESIPLRLITDVLIIEK